MNLKCEPDTSLGSGNVLKENGVCGYGRKSRPGLAVVSLSMNFQGGYETTWKFETPSRKTYTRKRFSAKGPSRL